MFEYIDVGYIVYLNTFPIKGLKQYIVQYAKNIYFFKLIINQV